MGSVNKVILLGRLGADPELRYTGGGQPVANFRIATTERIKRNENWEERTEWHRVVVWGKLAENCSQYLSKGREVYVEGRLQTRQWNDQNGNTRYTTEIVAREVVFLSGGRQQNGPGQSAGPQANEPPPPEVPPDPDPDIPCEEPHLARRAPVRAERARRSYWTAGLSRPGSRSGGRDGFAVRRWRKIVR